MSSRPCPEMSTYSTTRRQDASTQSVTVTTAATAITTTESPPMARSTCSPRGTTPFHRTRTRTRPRYWTTMSKTNHGKHRRGLGGFSSSCIPKTTRMCLLMMTVTVTLLNCGHVYLTTLMTVTMAGRSEGRHLLDHDHHQQYKNPRGPNERQLQETSLRYLSLGGPSTWGLGLDAPEPILKSDGTLDAHHAAYPYRLSPENVHTLGRSNMGGSGGGGPTMPALCTQSLVEQYATHNTTEQNVYDVITLEYALQPQPQPHEEDGTALALLAQRLRQRFPNALMVLVQLWNPANYHGTRIMMDVKPGDDESIDFVSWRRQFQHLAWDSEEWKAALSEWEWTYSAQASQATVQLQAIADQVQGQLIHLAAPADAQRALETANTWFLEVVTERSSKDDEDQRPTRLEYALSSKGHLVVANHIRSIVDPTKLLDQPLEHRNALGDWGSGDQCQLWYDHSSAVATHSSNLHLVELTTNGSEDDNKNRKRYALEIPTTGGSVMVDNPFDEDRMVYLTYLTTSQAQAHKVYPKIQVQLVYDDNTNDEKKSKTSSSGVRIDPYHDDNADDRHRTRTTAIGRIPADTNSVEVKLQPLEQRTLQPFRLVGVSLLAKEQATLQIAAEFALAPESLPAGQ